MKTKVCSKCSRRRPITMFRPQKGGRDGRMAMCSRCHGDLNKQWFKAHPHYTTKRARQLARDNPAAVLLASARARAKKIGIPFTLTTSDVIVPQVCPLLGIPIISGKGRRGLNNSPSLDRRDPKLGYTPSNTWVVSWRANVLKRDATLAELELLTSNLRRATTEV